MQGGSIFLKSDEKGAVRALDISSLREREGDGIFTVSELNLYIKTLFENNRRLSSATLRGEISNFTSHRSGHLYLSLKDESGQIRAVMFRSSAIRLKFIPSNGMRVIVHGTVSVYERDGTYQFYINSMQPDGIGALYLAYEQLKERLGAEGLFDPAFKKRIPRLPKAIGVITSPTGAAVRDIINVITRRYPPAKIYIYPALVQGEGAEASLIKALDYFDSSALVDTVIIGRGGGSIEDLWAFNSEALARRIFSASVPVISAVGHETDFTICDFVADLRAPTPSAAAELAVADVKDLIYQIDTATERCISAINRLAERASERLDGAKADVFALASGEKLFEKRRDALKSLSESAESALSSLMERKAAELRIAAGKAEAMSPLAVLSRGYSVLTLGGSTVHSIDGVELGDRVSIRISDGALSAEIKAKTKLK